MSSNVCHIWAWVIKSKHNTKVMRPLHIFLWWHHEKNEETRHLPNWHGGASCNATRDPLYDKILINIFIIMLQKGFELSAIILPAAYIKVKCVGPRRTRPFTELCGNSEHSPWFIMEVLHGELIKSPFFWFPHHIICIYAYSILKMVS